ncbi:TPA: hypothetical protein ACQVH3_003807 [Serratia marcescens]
MNTNAPFWIMLARESETIDDSFEANARLKAEGSMNNQFSCVAKKGKVEQGSLVYRGDMKNATLVALIPEKQSVAAISFDVILQNSDQLFNFIQSKTDKETFSTWNNYLMRKTKTNKGHTRITLNITVLFGDNIGILVSYFL